MLKPKWTMVGRRKLMIGLSCAGVMSIGGKISAQNSGALSNRTSHNVRDFGAVGDGIADDTAAFNRATRASATWTPALEYAVFVPAGRYRIAGSVYVRKGQTLYGEGLSTHIDASNVKQSTFILGKRLVSGKAVDDPGGSPVKIANLRGLGGAAEHGFIYTNVPGFQITGLFLSATGIGIEIEAADGIMSDIAIDMCLNGIIFRNCQNIVVTNVNIYWPNYAISFMGGCRDIIISNTLICYTKYASVLFGDSVSNIDNIIFNASTFINNVQYETFSGYIYNRASHVSAIFRACTFRNWPRHAINHGAGVDVSLSFDACVFDGTPTNAGYDKSSSAKCIITGSGRYRLTNCEFRNLHGEIATIGGALAGLTLTGGSIMNCATVRMKFAAKPIGTILVRDVEGFASLSSTVNSHSIILPWWGPAMSWQIRIGGAKAPIDDLRVAIVDNGSNAVSKLTTAMGRTASEPDGRRSPETMPTAIATRTGPSSGQIRITLVAETGNENKISVDAETIG
jgi:hypothetical protein